MLLYPRRFAIVAFLYFAALIFAIGVLIAKGGAIKDAGWTWTISRGGAFVDSVDPLGPAKILSPGARIVALNGDRQAAKAGPRPWLEPVLPGKSYDVEWLATDGIRHSATLTMGRQTAERDLEMGLCDLLLNLSFAIVGFMVWAAKPKDPVARLCSLSALLFAFYLLGSAIGPASPMLTGAPLVAYFLLKSIFPFHLVAGCAFFARFPTGERVQGSWRIGLNTLAALGILIWIVTFPQRLFPLLGLHWRLPFLAGLDLWTRPELGLVPLRHGFIALSGVFLFAVIFHNYKRLTSDAMRLRVRWVMLGVVAGVAPGLIDSMAMAVADAAHWLNPAAVRSLVRIYSISTISLAAIPTSIAYAILCNRLMGIRVALTSGIQFLLVGRVAHVITLVPAFPLGLYLWRHRSQPLSQSLSHPVIFVPALCAVVLLLFRKELLDAIHKLLGRLRDDRYRVLDDFLETLFTQHSVRDIASTAALRLDRGLRPRQLYIYCAQENSGLLTCAYASQPAGAATPLQANARLTAALAERGPLLLDSKLLQSLPASESRWISEMRLAAASPISGERHKELSGAILLGEKESGENYYATDLDFIDDAASQIYLALKMNEIQVARDRAVQEREKAEESGRTRSHFLAQMSHELRNPLTRVVGLTDLLLTTPLSDDQKDYAEVIRRSSEWMVTVANDMLDLARMDAGKLRFERVQFEWLPLLEDLAVMTSELAKNKDLEIVLHVESGTPPSATGDPSRIRQVLFNLLHNAVKFTEKGWVLMYAKRSSCEAHRPSIEISVEDTGPGIPDDDRERIFRPFEQTGASASQPGSAGLGLAISRRLVDAMGGTLTLDQRPARGAKFSLQLPVGLESKPVPPIQSLRGRTILCLDPLPVSLRATYTALSALGAHVLAGTGQELVRMENIDAVVLSEGEVADTAHIIRQCRRMQPGVPVIVLHRVGEAIPNTYLNAFGRVDQIPRPPMRKALLRALDRAFSAEVEIGDDPRSAAKFAGACGGVRVLVIDDDPASRRVLQMALAHLGCVTEIAPNAAQGLEILRAGRCDLVLVDAQLPGMDGVEFTRELRQSGGLAAETPVVAISGHVDPRWRESFLAAGASDYLLKPATLAEIYEVIELRVRQLRDK